MPQVPVTRDKSRTESARAVEWRSRLAGRVLRPSSIVHKAQKKRSARNLVWAFSQGSCLQKFRECQTLRAQPDSAKPSSLHSLARARTRHEDAPPTALRLSGAMGGSRNSGRRVGGGGLGSVRPRSFRAPRCRHARPPPPPPGFLESARGLSTPSPDALPPLRAFPRLVHDRVSRARLPATAPTSAATTGDSSSRATTATSRISTPTARSDQICAL